MWPRRAVRKHRRSSGASVYFGVVEPGTLTLRLLVVEVVDGQSTVLGWAEGPGWRGADTDWQRLATACENALVKAEEMAQSPGERWVLPDQILVGLAASQLRGRAWTVVQRRSRPDRPIDEQELESLLGRALRLAVNRLRSDVADGSAKASTWLPVDAAPVALTIDGRGVTDLVGFRGREMGATVFVALAQAEVVETWGLVARELEFSALTLSAIPLALAASLTMTQGLLIDIGGTTTDLIWCRAGRPVMLDSLPVGGADLSRALIRKWNLSSERAEQLKRAYCGDRLKDEAKAQVGEVLMPGIEFWLAETEESMARLNREDVLPQHLYLLGGGSLLPGIREALCSLAWSEHLQFVRYPQVSQLWPTDVPGVVNRTGLGREMGDVPALALAAWAGQQTRSPARPARILTELYQDFIR